MITFFVQTWKKCAERGPVKRAAKETLAANWDRSNIIVTFCGPLCPLLKFGAVNLDKVSTFEEDRILRFTAWSSSSSLFSYPPFPCNGNTRFSHWNFLLFVHCKYWQKNIWHVETNIFHEKLLDESNGDMFVYNIILENKVKVLLILRLFCLKSNVQKNM